jgi:hypothetical protein
MLSRTEPSFKLRSYRDMNKLVAKVVLIKDDKELQLYYFLITVNTTFSIMEANL